MRRFELVAGTSSKFWQVAVDGTDLHLQWGRIGTAGQSRTKSFPTEAAARAAATKLVADKTGKGYTEVPAAATAEPDPSTVADEPLTPTVEAAAATDPAADAPPVERGTQPPWEPVPAPVPALAGRAAVGTTSQPSADAPRVPWREALIGYTVLEPGGNRWDAAVEEVAAAVASPGTEPVLSDDAVMVAVFSLVGDSLTTGSVRLVDYLRHRYGVPTVVSVLLSALGQLGVHRSYGGLRWRLTVLDDPSEPLRAAWSWRLSDSLEHLAQVLRVIPRDEYEQCLTQVRAAWPGLPVLRRLVVAQVFREETDLADEVGRQLMAMTVDERQGWLHGLIGLVRDREVLAAALKDRPDYFSAWEDPQWCARVLHDFGADAVERLAPGARYDAAGEALGLIGRPDAVATLARVASSSKGALTRLDAAATRWPAAAMAALAPMVAAGGKDASLLEGVLTRLVVSDPRLAATVQPWLDGAGRSAIDRLLERLAGPGEVAGVDELPPVLAAPPWLGKRVASKVPTNLVLEPLPLPESQDWGPGGVEAALTQSRGAVRAAERLTTEAAAVAQFVRCSTRVPAAKAAAERAAAAAAAGDVDGFVAAFHEHLATEKSGTGYSWHSYDAVSIARMRRPLALAVWNTFATSGDSLYNAEYAAATLGLDGLPGTIRVVQRWPGEHAGLLAPFASTACAPVMARCWARLKTARAAGRAWLLAHPEHAVAALVPAALGRRGEAKDCAISALRLLAAEGLGDTVREVARRWGRADVEAGVAEVLAMDPMQQLPSRMPTLPSWWQPTTWHRPVLRSGKALPDSALDPIGVMLALPRQDGVYPGIEQVRQACTPDSLAAFAWDAFSAWLVGGAASKEGWALTALGIVGDDEVARRITPMIRAWPGESQHTRAVTGLDVLAGIGSDVALMMLNGIAQKVKFKGLQDKARAKIAEVAADRGLTTDELADRLAPDLGLDAQGTLRLDFGPRWFEVGFDESLLPFVRDADRQRLKDLPKPRQADDAALAAEATKRYRQLKKDARTIAAQQVFRFELAMCDQRRWAPATFTELMVRHPLVRHVVRRLVWGAYAPDAAHPNQGGTLEAVFRVDEDGAFTTAADDAYDVPAGRVVGVVHPLHLDPDDAVAMGQLFADYEIVQPFGQLGRDTYALTDEEMQSVKLDRWKGRSFPSARAMGLVNRGWRRGDALDGGWVGWFTRDLVGGETAYCNLDPGMVIGMPDMEPEQTVESLTLDEVYHVKKSGTRFGVLDPVSASELIREMEVLTSPAG